MKIVIDTNIWISFLFGKILGNLLETIKGNNIKIISSEEQISEIFNVMNKPKVKKYISLIDLRRVINFINSNSNKVKLTNKIKICRDPKDDFIIETAINGDADYIITGDTDLLVLKQVNKIEIITYKELETKVNQIIS